MTNQEIDSHYLSFGVCDALAWMRSVPLITVEFVYERIFRSVTNTFNGHSIPLFHLDIHQKSPGVFTVTANRWAVTTLSIPQVEKKGGADD